MSDVLFSSLTRPYVYSTSFSSLISILIFRLQQHTFISIERVYLLLKPINCLDSLLPLECLVSIEIFKELLSIQLPKWSIENVRFIPEKLLKRNQLEAKCWTYIDCVLVLNSVIDVG